MRKIMVMMIAVLFLMTAVSAKTIVAGKIYDSPDFETANPVAGANINVTCNGNLMTIDSLSDGTYSVGFDTSAQGCPNGSDVFVIAEKNGITNSGTGKVHDYTAIIEDLYVGVVNIALIPEFGLFIAGLTIVSAIGIFFFVRRE